MNKYELVTIIDSQMPESKRESVNKRVVEAVTKSDGKVINSQIWLDKYKMAFSMKKCCEGSYYLTKFESAAKAIVAIRQILKLNEEILRFAIYKSE